MTNTIYKYPLALGLTTVHLAKGAKILTAQVQGDEVCIWAIINPEITEKEKRIFYVVGTGATLPDSVSFNNYISTVQYQHYVAHVFELIS